MATRELRHRRRGHRKNLSSESVPHQPSPEEEAPLVSEYIEDSDIESEDTDHLRYMHQLDKFKNNDNQYIRDVTVDFFYYPHTLTAIAVVIGALIYYAFVVEPNPNEPFMSSLRAGIATAAGFLLVMGLLVFPSGPFIRPHPLIWRLTFGVGVIYELWLIVLLFQSKSNARYMMQLLDPSLNQPLAERDYAADCELTYDNFKDAFFDLYALSHFIGWICKTMVLRDRLLSWTISITWELIEIAFTHMLPNFAECWWDQWILDVLLANAAGIIVGRYISDYFELRKYKWRGVVQIKSIRGKLERVALQFTPATWIAVRWNVFESIKRFLIMNAVVLCFHATELNAFFLKHLLWIPPTNSLNVIRLVIWLFVGLPAWRQLYVYTTDSNCKRIGNHSFLCVSIVLTELLLIIKLSPGEFTEPMSANVYLGVKIFLTFYVVVSLAIIYNIWQRSKFLNKLAEYA